MSFRWTVAMLLRFYMGRLVFGLINVLLGGYGLYSYKPLPDDSPFSYPIPYDQAFLLIVLVGCCVVVWAWISARRLAR